MTKVTDRLVEAVKGFEGLRLQAYKCPAGVWTIGYGHTRSVTAGMRINEVTASKWLREDLERAAEEVVGLLEGQRLKTHELDALTDFVFNLGAGAFRRSRLRRLVLEGASGVQVAEEFGRWVYAGKTRLPGLVKRRMWEAKRWEGVV